jgi:hypothetical protein
MANLTTLCKLKMFLGISDDDTSEDLALKQLITEVSSLIETHCNRIWGAATYTEYYSGDGTSKLILTNTPVVSITSINVDNNGYWGQGADAFASTTLLEAGVDYALVRDAHDGSARSESGVVMRLNNVWESAYVVPPFMLGAVPQSEFGNIKVVYVGGVTVPSSVELAAHLMIQAVRKTNPSRNTVGFKSESDEEYSYTLGDVNNELLKMDSIKKLLARYKRFQVG